MKKRIATFLVVLMAVMALATTVSAKAFDGGMVYSVTKGGK